MPSRLRRAARVRAFGARLAIPAAVVGAIVLACSLPGRLERILPETSGMIATAPTADPDDAHSARLTLVVIHSSTPTVHARREVDLSPDRTFRFDPILLAVAGQEFGRQYRVYLHFAQNGSDRVIWRAQFSRLEDAEPIRLDCDLDRPIALGEPCRVDDPVSHPWLLAEGKRHFRRLCADCHGLDARGAKATRAGSGATGSSPSDAPAPDLTRIALRRGGRFEHDAVAAWIEGRSIGAGHERAGMPVWGERLSNEFERYAEGEELIGATLDPIVAYLESLQERGESSP